MRQLYEYHAVVGYRYIPNLRARVEHEGGGYLMQVNEQGFRSNESFAKQRGPGRARVLVFGDSFTAGDAVPNSQRYTDLLQQRLGVDVYNFGLSSTGTDQQYLIWREFAQEIEHDVVVIAVFVENVRRVMAQFRPHRDEHGRERIYAKPYYELEGETLRLRHVPPRREPFEEHELSTAQAAAVDTGGRYLALRKMVTALGVKDVVQQLIRYQPLPAYDSADTPGWRLMRAVLSLWIRALAKPVVLMPLPLPQHLDEACDAAPYQARYGELATELGCVLHDPLPDMLKIPPAERRQLRWKTDIHFTPAGHEVLARSLEPVIARLLQPTR
ncbi:MAG TPA: GDSL-type esterase/lipase family protein [Duganella sp.]|uniref:SGNH/GDSL hydrolase family protein n=1 Tax=Duganella sp. TaxID=1904440 RepID=UPI002ED3BE55